MAKSVVLAAKAPDKTRLSPRPLCHEWLGVRRGGFMRLWHRAGLTAILALAAVPTLHAGAAEAQMLKPNLYPSPREGLRLFEILRPVDSPDTLHDWSVSLGYQLSELESKVARQPEQRSLANGLASLNARVGTQSFAALELSYSGQDIHLVNRGLQIRGDIEETGLRLSGGTMLLPYLAVGASLGRNALDGTYHFGPTPEDRSSGEIMSYGAFVALLYPAGDWKFSLTGAYSYDEGRQSFADGSPREQQAQQHVATTLFTALYAILPQLDGMASLAWHHVIDERTFLAGRASDEDWLRPTLGLVYRMTERASFVLTGSTYALNEVYNQQSVSLGLNLKF